MALIRKTNNGYYLVRGQKANIGLPKDIFVGRHYNNRMTTYINFSQIIVPEELIGKKLRFKVEIVENI